jgi:hypothetical protein
MHRLSGVINLKLLLLHNFSNSLVVVDFLGLSAQRLGRRTARCSVVCEIHVSPS